LTQGSRRVTFSSETLLPYNIGEGDVLFIGASPYTIAYRESARALTVQAANVNTSDDSDTYTIARAYSGNTYQVFVNWETARGLDLVRQYLPSFC
jgi:hypothetical protein